MERETSSIGNTSTTGGSNKSSIRENSKRNRLTLAKKRKQKNISNSSLHGSGQNMSRSERTHETFERKSTRESIISLSQFTNDTTDTHDEETGYEESFIKNDNFMSTYYDIIISKKATRSNLASSTLTEGEVELFKNINCDQPYELSYFLSNISDHLFDNIKKKIESTTYSTSMCVLSYIYDLSNIHIRGHYPHVYESVKLKELYKDISSRYENFNRDQLIMDGKFAHTGDNSLLNEEKDDYDKKYSQNVQSTSNTGKIEFKDLNSNNFSDTYNTSISNKYIFRYGMKNVWVNYLYTDIKPYYPPTITPNQQIKIEVNCLRGVNYNEPYFASLAFFDVKLKQKISEDFHFNVNDNDTMDVLEDLRYKYPANSIKNHIDKSNIAIFNTTFSSLDNVYLVLRIQKLQHSMSSKDYRQLYNLADKKKHKRHKEDVVVRLLQRPLLLCCMGWYAFSVKACLLPEKNSNKSLNESNNNSSSVTQLQLKHLGTFVNEAGVTNTVGSLECFEDKQDKYSDDDIIDLLVEYQRNGYFMKKFNSFKIHFTFNISKVSYKNKINFIPNYKTLDKRYKNADISYPFGISLIELYPPNCMIPAKEFQNVVYLELKTLNTFNVKNFNSKYLLCKVELIDGESLKPIKCFYNKINRGIRHMDYILPLINTAKYSYFKEYIKVDLPISIHEKTHFLFTFYGVNFEKNHDQRLSVGLQTWLPLFLDNSINVGKHALPLAEGELTQGYHQFLPTSTASQSCANWIDEQRPYLHLKLISCSSVFPSHQFVSDILNDNPELFFDSSGSCIFFRSFYRNFDDKCTNSILRCLYPLVNKCLSFFYKEECEIIGFFNLATMEKFSKVNNGSQNNEKIFFSFIENVFSSLICMLFSCRSQFEPFCDINGRCALLGVYSNYMFSPKYLIDILSKDYFFTLKNKSQVSNVSGRNKPATTQKNNINYVDLMKNSLEQFLRCWATARTEIFIRSMSFSWFLFELITKMIYILNDEVISNIRQPSVGSTVSNFFSGTTQQTRNTSTHQIPLSEYFYKYLLKLSIRCGQQTHASLVNDDSLHDAIGSSLFHFLLQCLQHVNSYIVRIVVKLFFDEIIYIEDTNINQRITEYKINLLNILLSDQRIVELDLFFIASQPKLQIYSCENYLIQFLFKRTPILNFFLAEIIYTLRDDPDLSAKIFDIVFRYILLLCDGPFSQTPLKDVCSNSYAWLKPITFKSTSPQSISPSQSLKNNLRSTIHVHVSLSLYPIVIYIMEFFNNDTKLDTYSAISSENMSNDAIYIEKFCHYCSENIYNNIAQKISKYGSTYLSNLCYLFIWIVTNLDSKYFIDRLNEWSCSRSFEFGVALYSCILTFQLSKSEKELQSLPSSVNESRPIINDNQLIGKLMDLHDGSITKSNALTLLKKRRVKRIQSFNWPSFDDKEDAKTLDLSDVTLHIKDDIVTETTANIILIINKTFDAFLNSSLQNEEIIQKMLHILVRILNSRQPVCLKKDIINLLEKFLTAVPSWLFGKDLSIIKELCSSFMLLFTSNNMIVRNNAINVCYNVFKLNLNYYQNLTTISGVIQLAVSSVTLDEKNGFDNIFNSFTVLRQLANKDKTTLPSIFHSQFESCIQSSLAILTNRTKIRYLENYGCSISVILTICSILERCYDCVDLRLFWLQTLLQTLSANHMYSSIGMCGLHIVVLCFEHLKLYGELKHFKNIDWTFFKILSDNLEHEVLTGPVALNGYNKSVLQFTRSKLLKLVKEAGDNLKKAHSSLLCYKTYSLLNDLYFKFGLYDKIPLTISDINECLKCICEGDYGSSTYFRVGFYGEPFESLSKYTEYIFHYSRIITLSEFCTILNEMWKDLLGERKLNIIKTPHDIEREKLNQNECYIQVTTVEPYIDSSCPDTYSEFEKRYNIYKFFYRTPYVMNDKSQYVRANASELTLKNQCSRLTIIQTKYSAPFISPCIPILHKEDIFETPIEVSIADLTKRSDDLLSICNMKIPNLVLLEGLLQGCVSVSVNQGPLAIAETFLQSPSSNNYTNKNICDTNRKKLINVFKKLLHSSGLALDAFKTHSDQSRMGLYEHMLSNYKQLRLKLNEFCSEYSTN